MTEEQIKEFISREYFRVIAHSRGYKVVEASLDHGVDVTVVPVSRRLLPDGGVRYLDSQYKLDFQLKSTTSHRIEADDELIRYDLEAKTFNDLVERRDDALPLHLVVVVLGDQPPTCVSVDAQGLSILGNAYWYLPPEGAAATENLRTIRIAIPVANRLDAEFIGGCYERLGIPL